MINLNKEGVAFAKIIGGKYNSQIVSVTLDKTSDKGFETLSIANDAKSQIILNTK